MILYFNNYFLKNIIFQYIKQLNLIKYKAKAANNINKEMTLNFLNIDLSNISKKLNFHFLIDIGKSLFFSPTDEKSQSSTTNLKNSIHENTLFKINSEILNIQNNKQEIVSSLDCFYSSSTEALCLIIDENVKLKELCKEVISNLMDFAGKVNAKTIILLLDNKKNKDYVKIMQSMMMIGFQTDKKHKFANLMGKEYKLLKFDVSLSEIEEIAF